MSQPQMETQGNNSTDDDIQPEPSNQPDLINPPESYNLPELSNQSESSNQDLNPIIDSKQYENSMLEGVKSSDPIHNPKFETIFVKNPDYNQSEGSGSQDQSEMIPMVVPYQARENLSEPSASQDHILESITSENSEVETETKSEDSEPEPATGADAMEVTIEPTVQEEVVESSIQEEMVEPSTQSPAPAPTPGNPWLMHIFGKFSHLVNRS